MGFYSANPKNDDIRRTFCGAPDGDGHFFWECPLPPLAHLRESPEFFFFTLFVRTAPNGPDVFSCMVGSRTCFPASLVRIGQSLLVILPVTILK